VEWVGENSMKGVDMYGWRGSIGFICPAISDTVLLEYYRVMPEGSSSPRWI